MLPKNADEQKREFRNRSQEN